MSDKPFVNYYSMSDRSLAAYIGRFIKHHRLNQNKTQDGLAAEAGISRSTLSLLERGESVTLFTLIQVLRVLNLLYVLDSFMVEEQISPLLLAKEEMKKRKRARRSGGQNHVQQYDW
jgi:transcriptional regulator with XRE-family HTH domain